MTNTKNLLITILTGLLALSLFTQPAQSASQTVTLAKFNALELRIKALETNVQNQVKNNDEVKNAFDLRVAALESNMQNQVKTNDAVKLIQYDRCLDRQNLRWNASAILTFSEAVRDCATYKP